MNPSLTKSIANGRSLRMASAIAMFALMGCLAPSGYGANYLIVESTNPDPENLPNLRVWQRDADSHGVYVTIAHDYLIENSTTDAFCYEGGTHFQSATALPTGGIEMHHTVDSYPQVTLVTEVIPRRGEVEFLAHYEAPDGYSFPSGLFSSQMCNICYKPSSANAVAPPRNHLFYDVYNPVEHECYRDYVRRCFIYVRGEGVVDATRSLADTVRFPHPSIPDPEDYRNQPWPWIQVYVGEWQTPRPEHQEWTSTDRYTKTVIGCQSIGREYAIALASDSAEFMFQGWACLHNLPQWLPVDAAPRDRTWRMKVYLMENDPDAILARATNDFPELAEQPYTPPDPVGFFEEDWDTGTIDDSRWIVNNDQAEHESKCELEEITPGDYAIYTEGPNITSGADHSTNFYSATPFQRGDNLRCNFKIWCDPSKTGNWVSGSTVYGQVAGPWHSSNSGPAIFNPEAAIRYWNEHRFAQPGDEWHLGGHPMSSAFNDALKATNSKQNSLMIRVWLGDEQGAMVEWSTNGGADWTEEIDTRGISGGTNPQAYLGWATYGCAVFIDDIVVQRDTELFVPHWQTR